MNRPTPRSTLTHTLYPYAPLLRSVNGDGETSRDFCFIDNVIQANILASLAQPDGVYQVYTVAYNARTSLNELFNYLAQALGNNGIVYDKQPVYRDFRAGDVRHSQADISKAKQRYEEHPSELQSLMRIS